MKKELKEIRTKQNELVAKSRAALEEMGSPSVTETRAAELETQSDGYMAEYDELETRAARIQRIVDAEESLENRGREVDESRRPDFRRSADPTEERTEEEPEPLTAAQAFGLAVRFGMNAVPVEARSLIQKAANTSIDRVLEGLPSNVAAEIRAQAVGTGAAGGFTVPDERMAAITKTMAIWGPMFDPDVIRLVETGTGADFPWPTVDDTANTSSQLAENAAASEQDVTFGQVVLGAFKHSSDIVKVSIELLQDSFYDMDALLDELFGERLGRGGNTALTTGTGSSQPNGIVTACTVGKTAASATAVTLDELIDLQHSVDPAYRSSPKCRWQFNDTLLSALRKIKDSDGNYIWQAANAQTGAPALLLEKPYSINQAIASPASTAKSVVFGDHSKYVVRRVRDFTMLRLVERYAEAGQVGFLAFSRFDGDLIDTAAIKVLQQAA